jgi:hypothetical protein
MPLVRIDISKTASRERVPDVGNAVYNAIIASPTKFTPSRA